MFFFFLSPFSMLNYVRIISLKIRNLSTTKFCFYDKNRDISLSLYITPKTIWAWGDLNSRPLDYQSSAPTKLSYKPIIRTSLQQSFRSASPP